MKHLTDEEVMLQLQGGDMACYDELVARFKDRLYGFILRMVRNGQTSEDLLQETFLRLYVHRMSYRTIARFSTWIYTIAANLVRSHMRKQNKMPFTDLENDRDDEKPRELPDRNRAVDLEVAGRMTVEAIREAMDSLPVEFREVIILREIEELSYEEIVQVLGVPLGTVKSRVNRARGRLKELLRDYVGD
jgi:RNA polymerase sigma-70 factor (ECF subfamily)